MEDLIKQEQIRRRSSVGLSLARRESLAPQGGDVSIASLSPPSSPASASVATVLQEQNLALSTELASIKQTNLQLTGELAESQAKSARLCDEIAQAQTAQAKLQSVLDGLHQQLAREREVSAAAEESSRQRQSALDAANRSEAEARKSIELAANEQRKLEQQLAETERAFDAFKVKAERELFEAQAEHTKEAVALKRQISGLQKEHELQEAALVAARGASDRLQRVAIERGELLAVAEKHILDQQCKMTRMRATIRDLKQEIKQLNPPMPEMMAPSVLAAQLLASPRSVASPRSAVNALASPRPGSAVMSPRLLISPRTGARSTSPTQSSPDRPSRVLGESFTRAKAGTAVFMSLTPRFVSSSPTK
eukprot:TRINITY_DN13711_c0_g1_i1.p1 TRINITY_DN13711_c0_g1~~TRINITY_DN13711_c0_g1_i1.p1  ORF type:complete len:366 (+),score=90.90 TRINITY_DN13711_c0_g1_i1:156-1253(+)